MQNIDHSTIDAHLAKEKRKADRKAAARNVEEEMVQFIICHDVITNDDLLRDFTQLEIDTHFETAKGKARRRMALQRAA
jgi:hypothetical protein